MKLHYLDRSNTSDNSFSVKHHVFPYFLRIWHYHPELELSLIVKSKGTRFVGDSIERFQEGDVILIGEKLPHMWLNDDKYFSNSKNLQAEAIAIHFRKDFMGKDFCDSKELRHIKALIEKSRYGLKFNAPEKELIAKIESLVALNGFEKLMSFLNILNDLTNHKDITQLSSKGYLNIFREGNNKKMSKTHEYIFKNFNKGNISLEEVASIAHMSASAFSRSFKRVNGKTFNEYVNEVRIGYACKLLNEYNYNISRVSYESGYNNISNFNRQFKKITGRTPSDYIKQYKKLILNEAE
ncbi:AraC family transcriptional regulator [Flagellimonas marina]|uniref:AraC family transcriptional regulator n=1 Tax=Flagellimonas marina TaxID=1775168 RepID=A0ABV8PSL6_9FLAO